MFGKKKKENKWYGKAYILNRKHKLPEPYCTLFKYYECVNLFLRDRILCGHRDYFVFADRDGYLDSAVANLKDILPENHKKNFLSALDKYRELGRDAEYEEVEDAYDEFDYYAFDHIDELKEILRSYITEMTERHLF